MTTNEIHQIVDRFFTVPGFPFELGLMISVAIILGFLLYDDWQGIGKWAATVMVYIFFQEWLRGTILASSGIDHSNAPIILDIIGSTMFMIGAGLGAYIAHNIGKRINNIASSGERVLHLIKTGEIDQVSKPLEKHDQINGIS